MARPRSGARMRNTRASNRVSNRTAFKAAMPGAASLFFRKGGFVKVKRASQKSARDFRAGIGLRRSPKGAYG